MKSALSFLVVVLCSFSAFANTINGTVKDATGQPLAGASVALENVRTVVTNDRGAFGFEVPSGSYALRVSHAGFQTDVRTVHAGEVVEITLKPALAESIVVSGIRAEAKTPVTKSDVDRAQIEKDYYQQDIPLLLRDTPSIVTYTEAGVGGSGYSYVTLRGISPTRINMTLDGVPLADSEDMGVYFADFPDLAHSLQSIQVQRGVGTSTVGSPSFGGSINFQSIDLAATPGTSAEIGGGSFGTKFATVGWQSGDRNGFQLYTRLSGNQSDGFRTSSGYRGHDLFVSAAKQFENAQLRLTGFTAHEWTQQSFLATDAETLKSDLRHNDLSPEDRDSFGYDLGQLQYIRALGEHTSMTASAFYQRGYGWYRLFDDETTKSGLRQYGLDGMLLGGMATLSTSAGPWTMNYGLHLNDFRREHTRDLVGGGRDYFNYGTKGEANTFARVSYDSGATHLYGDVQLRHTSFHYHGDVSIAPIHWTFFNPKIGGRYDLSPSSSVYASAGLSTREPTRNDLFQGEDNASFAHDLHAVRPERLLDLESGWDCRTRTVTLSADVYAMEFRHEIASTGELSDIGLLLRRNVDRSYRRGIELSGRWQTTPKLTLHGNATLSRNRIHTWTQFFDVYDANGNFVDSRPIVFHDVNPVLTPTAVFNAGAGYTPNPHLSFGLVGRYISKMYLDNTNNDAFVTPRSFDLDGNASVSVLRSTRLKLQVNNALNSKKLYPSGYSYQFISDGKPDGISYYYPQATRNVVVMLDFTM